jgi:hypothetical protein
MTRCRIRRSNAWCANGENLWENAVMRSTELSGWHREGKRALFCNYQFGAVVTLTELVTRGEWGYGKQEQHQT